ncbi:MAG TPA: hypothetical protein EYF95_04740 [Flavobacteriales bacterium]|jgi:hypothetical protein|nr:hypothetical protein [Flavobacteriales bacterium]HIK67255.1 hypothetical protein [Flavobacteriales bacterium]
MAYENKPGSGALFPNDKKGNEKAPDMTGNLCAHRDMKAGEEFQVAMWKTKSKAGKPYGSLKASDKQGTSVSDSSGDELPF